MMCLCALDVCTDWASGPRVEEWRSGGVGGNARGVCSRGSGFVVFVVVGGEGGMVGCRIQDSGSPIHTSAQIGFGGLPGA